ncbi:CpsB/CapC family capsule biosynthesis tyrosine phosphatase [uncultured Paludibaculum sp.]|uniref:tyrosine-protein phosphatase n=1 Tax=uncultured Paludibaculum sp. TaxID=1765020 RepID=UPI002AAAA69B|nr:CpsB/CapC family capsule biosynthesis tyrosine phosphatase [uncultured Paludibaculum sp.]
MVDIHSHILFGMDDGARTLDDSLAMANMAVACGTTDIVASPHADSQYHYDAKLVDQRLEQVQRLIGPSLRIHRGCDFHLSYENIRLALDTPHKYSINGSGYLLVEFSDVLIMSSTEQIFSELQSAGLVPIVTHPERNPHLVKNIKRLTQWVENGSFLQITAQSILGQFGPEAHRCCIRLLDAGLVHFIASDGHDIKRRPPRLDLARNYVTQRYGPDYADLLVDMNPRSVVEGRPLDPGPMVAPTRRKPWYQFW